jgi:hypothetical protein
MARSVALAVVLLTSCGSFGASEVTSGAADASADGAAPSAPAGGADASPPDGGVVATGAPFCAAQKGAFVCEDFDAPGGIAPIWELDDELKRNTVVVEDVTGAPSSPRCLRVAAAPDAGAPTDAYLSVSTSIAVKKVTLEAKLRMVDAGPHTVKLVEILDKKAELGLKIRPNGDVEESTPGDGGARKVTVATVSLPPIGSWTHVMLTVDTTNHTGSATVGGAATTFPLDPAWTAAVLNARLGLIDASDAVQWTAYYDDVLVTKE